MFSTRLPKILEQGKYVQSTSLTFVSVLAFIVLRCLDGKQMMSIKGRVSLPRPKNICCYLQLSPYGFMAPR